MECGAEKEDEIKEREVLPESARGRASLWSPMKMIL